MKSSHVHTKYGILKALDTDASRSWTCETFGSGFDEAEGPETQHRPCLLVIEIFNLHGQ